MYTNSLLLVPVNQEIQEVTTKIEQLQLSNAEVTKPTSLALLDKTQLRDAMGKIVAETVQAIAKDNFERMQKCTDPANLKLLDGGIWYQNDYYNALNHLAPQNKKVQERLDWIRNKNYFYHSYAPKELFVNILSDKSLDSSPTGFDVSSLEIAKGVQPAQAIKGLLEGKKLALIDCLMIMQLGILNALHVTLETPKFNKLFNHSSGSPLRIGRLAEFVNLFFKKVTDAPAVGQITCAYNVTQQYSLKHYLLGNCASINLVISDASDPNNIKYVALGADGLTKDGVEQMLVDEQNKPPMDISIFTDAFLEKILQGGRAHANAFRDFFIEPNDETKRTALKNWFIIRGYDKQQVAKALEHYVNMAKPITLNEARKDPNFGVSETRYEFKIGLIQKLIQMPLEQVSIDFVRNYKDED